MASLPGLAAPAPFRSPSNSPFRSPGISLAYALALGVISACGKPAPPPGAGGPTEAVQAFSAAVQRGDAASSWALLSARSRQDADRLAAEVRKAAGDAGPQSGRQMLFGSAVPGGKTTARELSSDGGAAEVEVSDAPGVKHVFRTVNEAGGWKIDLDLAAK